MRGCFRCRWSKRKNSNNAAKNGIWQRIKEATAVRPEQADDNQVLAFTAESCQGNPPRFNVHRLSAADAPSRGAVCAACRYGI